MKNRGKSFSKANKMYFFIAIGIMFVITLFASEIISRKHVEKMRENLNETKRD